MSIPHTDLTQRPPRSLRVRLGGLALLPRMLDKGRATLAGKNGEYHYDCGLDQHLIRFLDFDPKALSEQLAAGKADGEVLEWLLANSKNKRTAWEIAQWSAYQDNRGPDSDAETLAFFAKFVGTLSQTREDLTTWAAVLDADDYASFGGKL